MAEPATRKKQSSRKKPHRVALFLSEEDNHFLREIVSSEKDTVTNVIRRMIRARYKRIFSPRPQALTLRLPSGNSDFGMGASLPTNVLSTSNEKDQVK